jgi:hypothetical protein
MLPSFLDLVAMAPAMRFCPAPGLTLADAGLLMPLPVPAGALSDLPIGALAEEHPDFAASVQQESGAD